MVNCQCWSEGTYFPFGSESWIIKEVHYIVFKVDLNCENNRQKCELEEWIVMESNQSLFIHHKNPSLYDGFCDKVRFVFSGFIPQTKYFE